MRERLRKGWKSNVAGWMRWGRRAAWTMLVGILLLGVSGAAWWLLVEHPRAAAQEARRVFAERDIRALERQDRVFATGGQLLLGIAVILGAGFALWRVLVLDKQVKITEQSQITERFTRAIDQLGDESKRTAVRLGGIYALERIAQDSPRDHPQVMEVLCAFVREETRPALSKEGKERVKAQSEEGPDNQEPEPPSTVVQAVLDVIGRNPLHRRSGNTHRLNLQHVEVPRAKLDQADLARADFSKASLSQATLTRAHLVGTDFSGAKLFRADLGGADLSASILVDANLSCATLVDADLTRAMLGGTNLTRAELAEAHCAGADFFEANLFGAGLSGADLSGADLSNARNLTREQIESARTDEHTRLPEGLV